MVSHMRVATKRDCVSQSKLNLIGGLTAINIVTSLDVDVTLCENPAFSEVCI